jgi:hypothetical protein
MKKVITIHQSFAEAERADKEYYRSLTPKERLDILLALVGQAWCVKDDGTAKRHQRVHRIIDRA